MCRAQAVWDFRRGQLPDDLTLLSLQQVLGDVGSEVVFTHDPDWDSAD